MAECRQIAGITPGCGMWTKSLKKNPAMDLKAFILKANEEILNKGNYDYIDEIFVEDYAYPGFTERGPTLIRGFMSKLRDAFPDLEIGIEEVVQEGDWVAYRRTHSGTHQGEFMGFEPTGKRVEWEHFIVSHIVDGKIVEEKGQFDLEAKLRANAGEE